MFVFFGPVAVAGTYFVQSFEINMAVILAGFGPGLISTAILAVNNLRDISGDAKSGKRTLAVRFGRSFAQDEYLFCILAASFMPVIIYMWMADHLAILAAASISLWAIPVIKKVLVHTDGPGLNLALASTGKLLFIYSFNFFNRMGFMKIQSVQIYPYSLAFENPVTVRDVKFIERKGLIIQITSDQGSEGFGEAAPLPGLSEEGFEDVLDQAELLRETLVDQDIPENVIPLQLVLTEWLKEYGLKPSLQFAMEMAVLNLIAQGQGVSLSELFSEDAQDHVLINGLLQGTTEEVVDQAKECLLGGFKAMKLKVGRKDIDYDVATVKAVTEIVRESALLHLDANKAWSLKEAIEFGQKIGCACVDYIEEPLKDTKGIAEFFKETTIPVALDESLRRKSIEKVCSMDGVDVLILKPTILGGIEKINQIIQYAQDRALRCVISSSFESSLGIATLAQLSASLTRHAPAGLDTLKYIQTRVLKNPFTIQKGRLTLDQCQIKKEDIEFDVFS